MSNSVVERTTTAKLRRFASLDELEGAVGENLGLSDWMRIDQERIDRFADATADHQWIHVDAVRAADGPFGATIAHGYLTLSLVPMLGAQVFSIEFGDARLNYGLNKVRFPNTVKVGAEVRVGARVVSAARSATGSLVTVGYWVEIRGEDKPACVAESIVLVVHS